MTGTRISELDSRFVWHPFTQHGTAEPPLPVASARGAWLELEDGRRIIDGISSWWVNLHGHAHPAIASAIAEQAARLEHVIFAGFTHEPGARLAETLVGALRERGARSTRIFYTDNGSTAVEAALKMALQFHDNRGERGRRRLLALRGSYHGDTWGSMSVSEPDGFHARFRDLLLPVDFVEPGDLARAGDLLTGDSGKRFAAVIVEPMVQGASGMRFYPPGFLTGLARLAREAGVLLICDEIFTGFHRTGPCFAFEHAEAVSPDLVCLSKGITGGFLPLAAVAATEEIFEAFLSERADRAFLHGHSYTANPVACAAALASWELLQSPECQARIRRIEAVHRERTQQLAGRIPSARSLGTIGAVDSLGGTPGTSEEWGSGHSASLRQEAIRRGVLLRPLGKVLYTVPPYCVSDEELHRIWDVIEELSG
jgi:adenosylmethionine-8-amino-7-oxononanoate aminotransferase